VKRSDGDHAGEALEHLEILRAHVEAGSWEDQVTVDAVCLRLAAAIDASSRLSEAARAEAFGTLWPAVRATRNRIVHGYVTVDAEIVRATVEHDLDGFAAALRRIGRDT
jgi:uncharacterized protein with HEPN domain